VHNAFRQRDASDKRAGPDTNFGSLFVFKVRFGQVLTGPKSVNVPVKEKDVRWTRLAQAGGGTHKGLQNFIEIET
jgi:hypothetical protein